MAGEAPGSSRPPRSPLMSGRVPPPGLLVRGFPRLLAPLPTGITLIVAAWSPQPPQPGRRNPPQPPREEREPREVRGEMEETSGSGPRRRIADAACFSTHCATLRGMPILAS
ncbi:hypothetical protein Misp03_34220 [Microbispora sp. NBRC 16548]|nr:hypothetical protein Misp03_34220 [Microbispora sp. NBRC 16548]